MYYYDSVQLQEFKEGYYTFFINSTMDIHFDLYENYFDPMNPDASSILRHYGDCGINQVKFTANLKNNERYFLTVSTKSPNVLSWFSVTSTGPSSIYFSRNCKLIIRR